MSRKPTHVGHGKWVTAGYRKEINQDQHHSKNDKVAPSLRLQGKELNTFTDPDPDEPSEKYSEEENITPARGRYESHGDEPDTELGDGGVMDKGVTRQTTKKWTDGGLDSLGITGLMRAFIGNKHF